MGATGPGPAHAAHDALLVAAYAAGDATGDDLARAAELVASCEACARLHRDLRALAAALARTPAPARPRDFRLDAAQAARLARGSGWRRLLAPFSGRRSAAGPLAASLAALGMAGLLLGGGTGLAPVFRSGASTGALAPAMSQPAAGGAEIGDASASPRGSGPVANGALADGTPPAPAVPTAAPAAAPSAAASAVLPLASTPGGDTTAVATGAPETGSGKGASGEPPAGTASAAPPSLGPSPSAGAALVPERSPGVGPAGEAQPSEARPGPSPLALLSLALVAAGLVLGLLRVAARRLA